ncbi:MAG: NAD-dependent epimerase/dehydratase family protein [Verrucomicrobia bacterium]|jgi:GDP-L-fucose synthase|nr:NAD-dependent epimerase/dehydratase family protein [Verrucomicrobiota bacterium]
MDKNTPIFVAGHRGMVGAAVWRRLEAAGYNHLLGRTRSELDLLDQRAVADFFAAEKPGAVVFAAARVGGIHANNTYPSEFLYENLMAELNCIQAAFRSETGRFLFLGSSCIYPREAPQPMPEECLLTSPLEQTNEAYALAKISGLKYCSYLRRQYGVLFHSAMPTNLYGPGDNYHPQDSHVLPALIRRFHEAKEAGASEVVIWGTGSPRREFLHVDDLADGLLFLLRQEHPPDWVNLGSGEEISIRDLAGLVAEVTGFAGAVKTDPSKPDGTPRKLMDNHRMREMGWRPRISLRDGIANAYEDFLGALRSGRLRS